MAGWLLRLSFVPSSIIYVGDTDAGVVPPPRVPPSVSMHCWDLITRRTILLTLLLYTVGESFATVLFIIAVIVCSVVFWLTKGIAFGYLRSKLSENTGSTLLAFHLIISIILALALPNNYLISFPFFESLYNKNELWIPVTMFGLLVVFVTLFGLFLSLIFRPSEQEVSNPNHSDDSKEVYHSGRYWPTTLVLVATGAFFFWILSGFRGSFNQHMSRYTDSDNKYYRNLFTGLIIFVLLLTTVSRIMVWVYNKLIYVVNNAC